MTKIATYIITYKNRNTESSIVLHDNKLSTWQAEAGESRVQGQAGHQWLMPIILVTQEAKIRRLEVRSHPGQIVHKTLS
jgi:hypothetical protein